VPRLELLEKRCLPSTVTNLSDHDPGSLRDAIATTPPGGTVDFQLGLSGTIVLTSGELDVLKNLTIAGPGANVITVSGNHASREFNANANVTISGLTIADGYNSIYGGGIFNSSQLFIHDCIIQDNAVNVGYGLEGGGLYNAGFLTVDSSQFIGNTTAGRGGGISNKGTLSIIDSTITGNSATYLSTGAIGGGIYTTGPLTVVRCIITGNHSAGQGGGLGNGFSTMTVTDSTLSNNDTTLSDGGGIYTYGNVNTGTLIVTDSTLSGNQGSGIVANGGMLTVVGSTFSGNHAGVGAGISSTFAMAIIDKSTFSDNHADASPGQSGGAIANGGTMTVTNSTMSGNTAGNSTKTGWGGAIYNQDATIVVANCTLTGNSAAHGGAVNNHPSLKDTILQLSNSTVSANLANDTGGGIAQDGGTLNVFDTIVAQNTAPSSPDINGVMASKGHNLIGDSSGGSGYDPSDLLNVDPLLGPLQDNGGPTQTMALLPGSPAIDAGDNTDAPPWDQRGPGYPRITSDDPVIDIGAFEAQATNSFVVTNTNDVGPGSLRQAIMDADGSKELPTISFSIPGSGTQTIFLASPLPVVTRPMIVDGTTEPGYSGQPLVVVDGASAGDGADGLTITAGNTTIKGLAIDDFAGPGVRLNDSGGDVIVTNYLGTDATGSQARGNQTGIRIDSGSGDRIGGVIAADRNLISGNREDGIAIGGGAGHQVLGNFIGTDASGTRALPNDYGIELFSGSNSSIGGGTDAGAGNLISGNVYDGIGIYSDGNILQGNRIGTDASGTAPLGNGHDGVEIQAFLHGYDNLIGGTVPGGGNLIAFNGGYGVRVMTGTGNAIRQNAILANGAGGIALLTGGNHNEPAPALTSAMSGSGMTTVEGSVMSDPNTELAVEFFANAVCDSSGFGQGERYLDTAAVTTDSGGLADFMITLNQEVDPGQFITATATDPGGNTSTFSNCQVVSGPTAAGQVSGSGISVEMLSGVYQLLPSSTFATSAVAVRDPKVPITRVQSASDEFYTSVSDKSGNPSECRFHYKKDPRSPGIHERLITDLNGGFYLCSPGEL
jgi:hypothetical protein